MQRQFVVSSDLRSVGYDPQQHVLEIEFNSGGIYHYSGAPASVYTSLISAASKGQYFHRFIKDVYTYQRVG